VKKLSLIPLCAVAAAALLCPWSASAQRATDSAPVQLAQNQRSNVPAPAAQAQDNVESVVKRYGIGVIGGVGLDPELIMFGAHGTFGPIFSPGVQVRPGIEFGIGEVTTLFGINLDVLYTLPGTTGGSWSPYIGAGPNFSLSHRTFEDDTETTTGTTATTSAGNTTTTTRNRFNFSDTDFDGGFNFIAGARRTNGLFIEMKATAYGVSNVRLLAGFNF
jgi:hypothetical protein